jgi:hypothetical protein
MISGGDVNQPPAPVDGDIQIHQTATKARCGA